MPRVTIVFAVLLIVLGVVGYTGEPTAATRDEPDSTAPDSTAADSTAADSTAAEVAAASSPPDAEAGMAPKRSITALIPAFAGGLLLMFGGLALNENWRKHAMHGAVLVGLLGTLAAGGRGAGGLMKWISGDATVNTRSLFFVCAMAVLCGVFVILCVNSFIQARKRRTTAAAGAN